MVGILFIKRTHSSHYNNIVPNCRASTRTRVERNLDGASKSFRLGITTNFVLNFNDRFVEWKAIVFRRYRMYSIVCNLSNRVPTEFQRLFFCVWQGREVRSQARTAQDWNCLPGFRTSHTYYFLNFFFVTPLQFSSTTVNVVMLGSMRRPEYSTKTIFHGWKIFRVMLQEGYNL